MQELEKHSLNKWSVALCIVPWFNGFFGETWLKENQLYDSNKKNNNWWKETWGGVDVYKINK